MCIDSHKWFMKCSDCNYYWMALWYANWISCCSLFWFVLYLNGVLITIFFFHFLNKDPFCSDTSHVSAVVIFVVFFFFLPKKKEIWKWLWFLDKALFIKSSYKDLYEASNLRVFRRPLEEKTLECPQDFLLLFLTMVDS